MFKLSQFYFSTANDLNMTHVVASATSRYTAALVYFAHADIAGVNPSSARTSWWRWCNARFVLCVDIGHAELWCCVVTWKMTIRFAKQKQCVVVYFVCVCVCVCHVSQCLKGIIPTIYFLEHYLPHAISWRPRISPPRFSERVVSTLESLVQCNLLV